MKLGEVTNRWITEIKRVSDIHPINKVSGFLQEEDSEGVKYQKCLSCNRGTALLWEWTFLKLRVQEGVLSTEGRVGLFGNTKSWLSWSWSWEQGTRLGIRHIIRSGNGACTFLVSAYAIRLCSAAIMVPLKWFKSELPCSFGSLSVGCQSLCAHSLRVTVLSEVCLISSAHVLILGGFDILYDTFNSWVSQFLRMISSKNIHFFVYYELV